MLRLNGPLAVDRLRAALGAIVARHETLRTVFVSQAGFRVPLQRVLGRLDPHCEVVELDGGEEFETRVSEAAAAELVTPFDFADGPLLRVLLMRSDADRHALVLTGSVLCVDAGSLALLAGELIGDYGDGGDGREDPIQFADFAAWQRELADGDSDERRSAAETWTSLGELQAPQLPFEHSARGLDPEAVDVELSAETESALRAGAERYGVSPGAMAHAAWCALLGRYGASESVATSYISAERRHADLIGAAGVFSRPVGLEANVGATVTVAELVRKLERGRERVLVLQDYAPLDGAPRPAIAFIDHDGLDATAAGLSATLDPITVSGHNFRVSLTCAHTPGRLALRLGFDPSALDRDSAERLARSLSQLLASVAGDPGAELGALDVLDPRDREVVLGAFNATVAEVPALCAHELFARHVAVSPDLPAVVDDQLSLSHRELDERANQLAQRLVRAGVGPDVAVGLCTERTVQMAVGLLGILKAGGAYVPLHHEHPRARLRHQLTETGARAIVCVESLLDHLPEFDHEVICLDRDEAALAGESTQAPASGVGHDHLAYVIYTSGSTGAPKGVGVTHGNLANYAAAIGRRLGADAEPMSFGLVTSIATDLGNTSVFGALCNGGTLVLRSPAVAADAGAFVKAQAQSPIDVLKITPSHLGALLAAGDAAVLPRRRLVLGGERAPWDLVDRVRALAADLAIINHYGPTEATIGACTMEVGPGRGAWNPATVPIGRPLANTRCYVLDARHEPVPVGVPGQLFIAGAGVARGYVGQPELTAERFSDDPFAPGLRMYDTGDLARWLPDGTIEFLGRADEQVKIRGYRVEPAEVETALRTHASVIEAAVVVRAGAAGDARLIAYAAAQGTTPDALQAHLAEWLPEFMRPSAIVVLETLPMTPSGKVDRLALPDPEESAPSHEHVAPRTPMEEAVATIWSRVLAIEPIGIEDDFFALGGHSLLATQVVAQVRSDFAIDLPLHSLFSYPTIESLTAEIVRMIGESEHGDTAQLLAELENLSDEDAERLLASEES